MNSWPNRSKNRSTFHLTSCFSLLRYRMVRTSRSDSEIVVLHPQFWPSGLLAFWPSGLLAFWPSGR